jgi:hypothetical protein
MDGIRLCHAALAANMMAMGDDKVQNSSDLENTLGPVAK